MFYINFIYFLLCTFVMMGKKKKRKKNTLFGFQPPVYIAYISTVDCQTCADLLLVYSIAHFETALTALIVIVMASMSIQKRKHNGRGDLSVIHQNNGQVTEKLLELLVLFLSLLLDYLVEVTILN